MAMESLLTPPRLRAELLGGGGQRLEVALDDGVDEHAGVFGGVSRRHVLHTRWWRRVDGSDGEIVLEPVLATDDARC
jgi:hypothetical protein